MGWVHEKVAEEDLDPNDWETMSEEGLWCYDQSKEECEKPSNPRRIKTEHPS